MASILYYIVVYPLSLLPLRVLYLFSDVFYVLSLHVFPYRKKVIETNLKNAFPNHSDQELNHLKRGFYRHFSDLLAEGIKNLSISENELRKRFKVRNPEVMNRLYQKQKSVLLVSGHYNNWEWLITSQAFLFPHKAIGIGMPLRSVFWDKKINQQRQRFGMQVVNSKNIRLAIEQSNEPIAILILGDQSPPDARKSYWMNFLNQKSAVLFGTEQLANEFKFSVVFFRIEKQKRGYYEMELIKLTEDPTTLKYGELTEWHTRLLEQEIQRNPSHWIWSHKRWKREVPSDLDSLKTEQEQKFNDRFKK
jgi:KDO2-lipid IV(A) lauroyltransferase